MSAPATSTWRDLAIALTAGLHDEISSPVIIEPGPHSSIDVERVRAAPVITVGIIDSAQETSPTDLLITEDELDAVTSAIAKNPTAATTLTLLLRTTPSLSIIDAIQAESLAFSTLQSGAEFAHWLAQQPAFPTPTREADGDTVIVTNRGDTTHIALNRPKQSNALNTAMRAELTATLDALQRTSEPIRLTGTGRNFCAGGDLSEFGISRDHADSHLNRMRQNLPAAVARVRGRLSVHIHGAAIGAGLELSSFAHRVTASPDAVWSLPEVTMGLIPGCGGTVSIPRRIGAQKTLHIAITGEMIDAERALHMGLIDAVEP